MHFNQYISQFEQDNKLIPVFLKLVSTSSKMSLHILKAASKSGKKKKKKKTGSLGKLVHLQVSVPAQPLADSVAPGKWHTIYGLQFPHLRNTEVEQLIF